MQTAVRIRAGGLAPGFAVVWAAYTQQAPQPLGVEKVAEDLRNISGTGVDGAISGRNDLLGFRRSFETMRNRMSDLEESGSRRDEAANMPDIEDLGGKPSPLFERSLPGLYDEVR